MLAHPGERPAQEEEGTGWVCVVGVGGREGLTILDCPVPVSSVMACFIFASRSGWGEMLPVGNWNTDMTDTGSSKGCKIRRSYKCVPVRHLTQTCFVERVHHSLDVGLGILVH